ncbi:MAG: 30S ribosomal protein S20 [Planctomycetota bacterium]|jgi:small subunit ribosomal protein S20|nr:30S ribosomal protein S20 [Planctomycetota bacterium]
MAHSKQAKKRIRQDGKRRQRNKATTSAMKTEIKKLFSAVAAGDAAAVSQALPGTLSRIDKAAKAHVIHRNAAARKKSQVARAVASMAAS